MEGLLDKAPFPVKPSFTDTDAVDLSSIPGLNSSSPPMPDIISEPILNTDVTLEGWDSSLAVRLKRDTDSEIPWLMLKKYTLPTLEGYMRTWSSLADYHDAHPDDKARTGKSAKEGDIVDRLMGKIKAGLEEDSKVGEEAEGEVVVGWPLVLMMIKKKEA